PLHRAGPGVLQREPQADPQGRGWDRVRRGQPDRAHGGQRRVDAEPVRQHVRVRLRPDEDPVHHPVQQARSPERRADQRPAGIAQPRLAHRGRGTAEDHARSDPRGREPGGESGQPVDRPRALSRGGGGPRRRPVADRLLRIAMLIHMYWLTRHPTILYGIPWWGSLPVWVALLLVGREVLITAFRFFAKRRGVVIPAAGAGKLKAVVQNVFIGATIAWFAWRDALLRHGWTGQLEEAWNKFHGWFVAVTLAGAILLTVYSLI